MVKKKRISVVDDYPEILEMIAETLSDEGFEVQTIANHDTAYEHIKTWQPHLIMLDLMAGTAQVGWVVLEQLKLDPETQAIPVVICSASSRDMREVSGSPYAASVDYLEKPFEIDTMLNKLEELLRLNDSAQKTPG